MIQDDVWITGLGAATPLGHDFGTIAANLLEGRSGIRAVTEFPVADQPSRIAGRVDRIPCPVGWGAEEFAARRPLEQLVLWCCVEALRDSGLCPPRRRRPDRPGARPGGRVAHYLGGRRPPGWIGPALEAVQPGRNDPDGTGPDRPVARAFRRLRQRQPCPGRRPSLAPPGMGRRGSGRWLRHGRDPDVDGMLRQPPSPVPTQRRARACLPPVRRRPRRLRDRRRRSRLRAGARPRPLVGEERGRMPRSPVSGPAATPIMP